MAPKNPAFTLFRSLRLNGDIVTIWHSANKPKSLGDEDEEPDSWCWLRDHISDDVGCQILVQGDLAITAIVAGQLMIVSGVPESAPDLDARGVAERLHDAIAQEDDLERALSRFRINAGLAGANA